MPEMWTRYLGLALRSPLIVSSNPLCADVQNLLQMQEAGAGAVVLPSLFEEQIAIAEMEDATVHATLPPALQKVAARKEFHHGTSRYLTLLHEAKEALDIPVIASLNGTSAGGWVRYARLLETVGADALELNIYYLPTDAAVSGQEIEDRFVHLLRKIRAELTIPLAVKLSPFFSSIPHMAARLANEGADGLVIFNRFYQPDFDPDARTVTPSLTLSNPEELRLRLRWAAILSGQVKIDLAITGGVHSGLDAVKAILAGAKVAMLASALLRNGVDHLAAVHEELHGWLDRHRFDACDDLRGHMSYQNMPSPAALERVNYMEELLSGAPAP